MRSVGWITCLDALKRKWGSYEWMAKQWIRIYYTAGSYQYLFVMLVWGINRFANLYSPQLIPVFLHERFVPQRGLHSCLMLPSRIQKVMVPWRWRGSVNYDIYLQIMKPHYLAKSCKTSPNSFSSSHLLIWIELISLLLKNKLVQCEIQVITSLRGHSTVFFVSSLQQLCLTQFVLGVIFSTTKCRSEAGSIWSNPMDRSLLDNSQC